MHSTDGVDLQHPDYCDRDLCTRRGPDLHHRSAEELFIPRQHDTTEAMAVVWAVERVDEVDEATGVQIEHAAELVAEYDDGRRVRWGLDDFRDFTDLVFKLRDQAQVRVGDRRLAMS